MKMGEETKLSFLDKERVKELWAFIKVELAKKAAVGDLANLVDEDLMAETIATALVPYAKTSEIAAVLAGALSRQVVDTLPSVDEGDPTVIYFVPAPDSVNGDVKDEYMLVNGAWERIGSTRIDLSGYWSKQELTAMTADELTAILNS